MIAKFWYWGVKTFIPYMIPGTIILALAKAGALLQNNLFIFMMIIGICVIALLVVFNKLNEHYYSHIIGAIGFALLLQTTLMGPGIMGSDIHTEYYFYYAALDGWDYTMEHPYNTAIGATVIAPFLTNVFHISGYWIFKVIYPLMFSFVPFLLYFVFKKEFGAKVAFFSALFFIIVPTWSMEMFSLPRQMLGELMLALCLYLVLVSKWRYKIRVPLIMVCGILGSMFHYVMGPTILLYLGIGCGLLVFFKRRVFPIKWLSLAIVVIIIGSGVYYNAVAQGIALKAITGISYTYATQSSAWTGEKEVLRVPMPIYEEAADKAAKAAEELKAAQALDSEKYDRDMGMLEMTGATGFIDQTSPLIRTAWGADFMEVNSWGKAFRVFQYLTQLAILVGLVCLIKNRKRYSVEYLCFCVAAVLILTACMFVPKFAGLINASRFYHLALFLLAPVFVLGGLAIFRNIKVLTICLIIPYYLFTSGFIFEATQQTDIGRVNMPYAISLSNHRIDMIGVFTSNDIAVRDWVFDNELGWVYADTHSYLLLGERVIMDPYYPLSKALSTGEFEGEGYIFLSERNNQSQIITLRPNEYEPTAGMRVSYSYDELGMDKFFAEGKIIYQQGDACILEVKQ